MVLWLTLRKLQSRDPEARKAAAKELASAGSGHAKALEALVAQLAAEPVRDVRCALVEALGELRSPAAVVPVVNCLDNDEEWAVQIAAATALGKLASADSVQPLVRALCRRSPPLRAEACHALDSMGWQPADSSLHAWRCIALKDWKGAVVLGEDTFAALETLLQLDDFATVAEGVTEMGATPQSAELLVRALGTSRYDWQRLPLLAAAAKLKDRRLVDSILASLEKLETEEEDARRSGRVLGGSLLYSTLKKVRTQRLAAIEALGELGDSRAAAALERLRERLKTRQAAAQEDSHARMVETLRARGVDGMADAAFGSLAVDLDLAEDAKAEDAITAALARLA